jgi:hypothetical protein
MPVQQQMSSFAGKLGANLATAYGEHKDKPIDLGGRRQLPANVKGGVAKLSTLYTKEQDKDDGVCPKGQTFFRASAVCLHPESCAGAVTQFTVPLCDIPAKGLSRARPFSENWNKFRSLFEMLGVAPFSEPPLPATASVAEKLAQGGRIEAYYMAAMNMLRTRAATNPIYIEFSTRGWTPKPTPQQPKPEEIVFEDWHGLAQWNGQHNPAAGVTEAPPSAPPTQTQSPLPQQPPPPVDRQDTLDINPELVAELVSVAMGDPEGNTEDGVDAHKQLEQVAWAMGWTEEQTKKAADWVAVGNMALTPPGGGAGALSSSPQPPTPVQKSDPVVGQRWSFRKRTKDGEPLKNNKAEPFPAQEYTVDTVDAANRTCVLRGKDGKEVTDLRTKKPAAVKWEWLEEQLPPY